uniref:Uncharacterized protein n=1 Tax=Anopheles atroparvus TaxID=41427 RepID=A0AAG5D7W7_ANOAO
MPTVSSPVHVRTHKHTGAVCGSRYNCDHRLACLSVGDADSCRCERSRFYPTELECVAFSVPRP